MTGREELHVLWQKYTAKEIDKQEFDRLLELIRDPDKEYEVKSLIYLMLSADADEPVAFDVDKVLARTDAGIGKIGARRKNIGLYRRMMPYAAAILLLGGLVTFLGYQWHQNKDSSAKRFIQADVAPGGNKATLTVAGKSYVLSEKHNRIKTDGNVLLYQDGTAITDRQMESAVAEIATPRGGQYRITLPDGTNVIVNAATKLRYPLHFEKDKREVTLEGEAYFEVAHEADRPFYVKTEKQNIKVLGTKFNMSTYAKEPSVTTLIAGSVEVTSPLSGEVKRLLPGQQAVLTKGAFDIKHVNTKDYIAWTQDIFSFNNMLLSDILKHLERWYDVEVVFAPSFKDRRFFAEIPRDRMLSISLAALASYGEVTFEQQGRRIIVK
ncbi:FecR family protein [Sphingobacterium sp. LRF_L2]|uniref:FecR family protein n=1 Tax=Sphingobacterium sp. LRF_L2 TaxID=3369421 RepID=UPI003F60EAFC